jgi:hypothetical protein
MEPEDYLDLIGKLKKNKPVVSHDEAGYPVYIYTLRKCTMVGTVQALSDGEIVNGFLEIWSGDIYNIIKLKSFLEKKIGSELEEIDMINYSSLTQKSL